jgi:hypothetical protein
MVSLRKIICLSFIVLLVCAFRTDGIGDFPYPAGKKNMLFYVQRSINKNTIVYEVNTDKNNELILKHPIKIYWINYSGKGDEEGLSFIQNKYAYGIDFKLLDEIKKSFSFHFVSYKKQTLFLLRNEHTQRYEVYSYFNHVLMKVNRIYVHIEGGSFWFPSVKYVQVSGINHHNGDEMTERIIP